VRELSVEAQDGVRDAVEEVARTHEIIRADYQNAVRNPEEVPALMESFEAVQKKHA
jgi:hypothetical protein